MSLGCDESLRWWDRLLGYEWVQNELSKFEEKFSTFREVKVLIVSWNCDAAKPDLLSSSSPENAKFIKDALDSAMLPTLHNRRQWPLKAGEHCLK